MTSFTSCACILLGVTLVAVVTGSCPPVNELECSTPAMCPEDRPLKIFSYLKTADGLECPACGYCVASDQVCPDLPCPMFFPREGCNAKLYPVRIRVAGNVCPWRCHVLRC